MEGEHFFLVSLEGTAGTQTAQAMHKVGRVRGQEHGLCGRCPELSKTSPQESKETLIPLVLQRKMAATKLKYFCTYTDLCAAAPEPLPVSLHAVLSG